MLLELLSHLTTLISLLQAHCLQCALLVLIAAIALSVAITYNSIRPVHVSSTVPGPKRVPFFGILLHAMEHWDIWPEECHRLSASFSHQTWGGPAPQLGAFFFTNDAANVRHILQTNFDNYVKGEQWRLMFQELLGNGIFTSDGALWKRHRKIISCMFSRNLMRHSAKVMKEKLMRVEAYFDQNLKRERSEKWIEEMANTDNNVDNIDDHGFNSDLQDLFYRITIDATSTIAFGVELHSLVSDKQHDFALAFDEMGKLLMNRFLDPFFRWKRFLRLSRRERRIRTLAKVLDEFAMGVVRSQRRVAAEGSPLGPDLLSRFIDHEANCHVKRKENKNKPEGNNKESGVLSDRELRDIAMNIILAGRDTTACALSWTFYELTRHPEVIEKIIDEVNQVCGIGPDAELTYDSMAKLSYTHAAIMEALRLHPPVANDFRYAVHDDYLPDGTFIPARAGVCLLPYSMGRNKILWGDDALEFKPERFLGRTEPSAYKYLTFYAGPRLCLGKPLALLNIKLTLAFLLPRYEFSDQIGHSGEFKWTLVQSMKGGFQVNVSRRKECQAKVL